MKKSIRGKFLNRLVNRKTLETLAGFLGGGWLIYEIVHWILIEHYNLPEELEDITIIAVLIALVSVLVSRSFKKEKAEDSASTSLGPATGESFAKAIITPKWKASIVVLPFANISPEEGQEYFCDGMTEEIITDLSYLRDLRVISRSSAMTLKGSPKPVCEVAKELDVQYVLEGSVRKAGNDLRITAQLIDAKNDAHLWADKFSGNLDDVFAMQEKISRSIVDALKLKLSPQEKLRLPTRPIENVYAYECYLQARQEIWRCTEETLGRAMQLIKNGLEIAGENDVLYSQMGIVFAQYINMAVSPDECYLQKAEECARKAFKLNPGSSQGQYLSGFIQWKRGHVQEGVKELKRALDNDPNNPDALMLLAYFYGFSGKAFAAWPLLKRVIGIDPLTPVNYNVCGWVNLLDGKFEDSHEAFLKMYKMEPENPIWRFFYSICLIYNNRFKDAHSVMDLILTDTPKGIFANLTSFLKHALQRDKATALASVTEELISAAKWDEQLPWEMAIAYALIDEKDKAIDWLEIATSRGWIPYPFLNHYDPFLANIRGEERFKKLMKRVKYDWEHFEV